MTDPSIPFQQAVYAALRAANVTVFHTIPQGTPLPYVVIGEEVITPDTSTTGAFWDVSTTVHVFAATVPAMKALTVLVTDTLNRELPVTGFRVGLSQHEYTRYLTDSADAELVPHGVIGLEYSLQSHAG